MASKDRRSSERNESTPRRTGDRPASSASASKATGKAVQRTRPPSIKDVAAAANVSWKTVSNVVNGTGRVGDATRKRVEEAIAALGYRPNAAGRQLRQGRTHLLALALPSIDAPYFSALAQAIMDAARAVGYTVFVSETHADPDKERKVAEGFDTLGIEGTIFSPLELSLGDIDAIRSPTPFVLLGERDQESRPTPAPTDHVGIDNFLAAREATRHLLQTGRTSLAFLGSEPFTTGRSGTPRLLGMEKELSAHGIELRPEWRLTTTHYSRAVGAAVIDEVLPRIDQIDGILCANDELALGVMYALRRNGVRVPEDLGVVGWDNIIDGRYSNPTLTTVAPDIETLARTAVERVTAQVEGRSGPPVAIVTPHRLLVRESTQPVGFPPPPTLPD